MLLKLYKKSPKEIILWGFFCFILRDAFLIRVWNYSGSRRCTLSSNQAKGVKCVQPVDLDHGRVSLSLSILWPWMVPFICSIKHQKYLHQNRCSTLALQVYGKYIVNVPLLQKSIRKIERKCTENAIRWVTVCYKENFKKLEFEFYLHVFLG